MLKKFAKLLELGFYCVGSIGGFGYCCYSNAFVVALGVAVLAWMAFPEAKAAFIDLSSNELD